MTKYRASLSEQQAALRAKNAKLRAELAERGIRPNAATGSYHDDGGRVAAPQLKISPSPLHWYDAVFDVQALSDVLHGGWSLRLSPALRYYQYYLDYRYYYHDYYHDFPLRLRLQIRIRLRQAATWRTSSA